MDAICREIGARLNGSWDVAYNPKTLPAGRTYFFAHYWNYLDHLRRKPDLTDRTTLVWYTHPRDLPYTIEEQVEAYNRAHCVIFTCTEFRDLWIGRGVRPERTAVVLGGADPGLFKGHVRGGGCVGLSSSYYERKNPDALLGLVQALPHRRFVLVGRGWEVYPRFQELMAAPNFSYKTATYKDYPAIYREFDVFLSLAMLEGGPIPLLEAMMENAVPVASRTGFSPDLIQPGRNGFLFEAGAKPAHIAPLVEAAFDLAADVRATVLPYSWDGFAAEIRKLGEGAPPPARPVPPPPEIPAPTAVASLVAAPAAHPADAAILHQAAEAPSQGDGASSFTPPASPGDIRPDMVTAYLNRGGAGNPVMNAFARGAGCRLAYAEDAEGAGPNIPVVWGVLRNSDRVVAAARAEGRDFFYTDHAYFGRGHYLNYRITRNAHEAGQVRDCPPDRAKALGLELSPWRRGDSTILVCPPTQYFMDAHGCPDWLNETLATLRACTDRPVEIRGKPVPGDPSEPLESALGRAYAIVTHSSNIAVEAAVAGVPVFVAPTSAAAPVGETDLTRIEQPARPDREAWLSHLAYSQFTLDEIASGEAWRLLLEYEGRDFCE
ncbi:glycosyltransferase [Brevundimonas sp.]|uniref:glycosyltransferase n=1 Tax=Brevundimonas sp. TaxID=1871086 RepID=UPI003D6D6527